MRGKGTAEVRWLVAVCAVLLAACSSGATAAPAATSAATNTAKPTVAPPNETLTPVPPVGLPSDSMWLDLQNKGFVIEASNPTLIQDGTWLKAFLVTNTRRTADTTAEETPTQFCQLLFYLWDTDHYTLLEASGADETEIDCRLANWEDYEDPLPDAARVSMRLQGNWSDINGNGLPELGAVFARCWACWDDIALEMRLYEVDPSSGMTEITRGLSGWLNPAHLFHSSDPTTLWVYDPLGARATHLERYWVYAWNEGQFVNVTAQFGAEYAAQMAESVAALEQTYGQSVGAIDTDVSDPLRTILILGESANLDRRETSKTFLKVSDPSHWPSFDTLGVCWLQVARAEVQAQLESGQPLVIPAYAFFYETVRVTEEYTLAEWTQNIDQTRFDVSACLE